MLAVLPTPSNVVYPHRQNTLGEEGALLFPLYGWRNETQRSKGPEVPVRIRALQHLPFSSVELGKPWEKGTGRVRVAARAGISIGLHRMRAPRLKISHQATETPPYIPVRRGAIKTPIPNKQHLTELKTKEKEGATLPQGKDIDAPGERRGCSPFPLGMLLHFLFLLNKAPEPSSRPHSCLRECQKSHRELFLPEHP